MSHENQLWISKSLIKLYMTVGICIYIGSHTHTHTNLPSWRLIERKTFKEMRGKTIRNLLNCFLVWGGLRDASMHGWVMCTCVGWVWGRLPSSPLVSPQSRLNIVITISDWRGAESSTCLVAHVSVAQFPWPQVCYIPELHSFPTSPHIRVSRHSPLLGF